MEGRGPSAGRWLCHGGGVGRRFVLLPRGCSQAGMTKAGQIKQTLDITPLPICPVCLLGQGLQGHPGGFLRVGRGAPVQGGGPSHAHLNSAAG